VETAPSIRGEVGGILTNGTMTRRGHSTKVSTSPIAALDSLPSADPTLRFDNRTFMPSRGFAARLSGSDALRRWPAAEAAAHSNRGARRGCNAAVAAQVCEFAGALMSHPLGLRKKYATMPRFAMSRHLMSCFVAFYLAEAVRP
jgi:hypothetical protein